MSNESAKALIQKTFQNPFDKERFHAFIKDLLNHIEDGERDRFICQGQYVPEAYRQYIKSYERIGKYLDPEEKKIDILVVYLQRERSLEIARSMQRNFIARYLNGSRGGEFKDAALVAFVAPNSEDWRFSLVKMEYTFIETPNGQRKVKEEFTPARRWSFLVGKNENSHTAQSRLAPIISEDEYNPSLNQLEEAFNIEKVTKEFFEKYRGLFIWVKEELDNQLNENKTIQVEFTEKKVNTIDFSKKLLGQIVFLYFLQKKGWFGVEKAKEWGTGSKNFLRELYLKKHGNYANFFNDVLEPLFYEALAKERDGDFYSRFNCKIPFLNGGLFDPINNYDWKHTDILIPNEVFSNIIQTKEGDIGNGLLDIFDRYNFTVKEDEPLEKEVAIDPEMLGKVFENLLEVQDRKSKGTYYTPREIVHYMCQQSLINYLYSELNQNTTTHERAGDDQFNLLGNEAKEGQLDITIEHTPKPVIPKEDIEIFINYCEQVNEHDAQVNASGEETESYAFKMPTSILNNAKIIDEMLGAIKICDPAVGSGAFLVGMMTEIIRARNYLSTQMGLQHRTRYELKRSCIEQSLYGVDIDPGAVEIAKLRLWLSLIVEEEDINKIKPLPNLDYKILCGNSLLGVEKNLLNIHLFAELEKLKTKIFSEVDINSKTKLKIKVENLISEITNGHKDFDFDIYFSEVFNEKKGFDIVIANPPYIRQEDIKNKVYLNKEFATFNSVSDLYTYFYEKGIRLLSENGILTYITSNKFMRAQYGKNIRNYLKNKTRILLIINFNEKHVFDAITNTVIFICKKQYANSNILSYSNNIINDSSNFNQDMLRDDEWTIKGSEIIKIKQKMDAVGIKLINWNVKIYRGILTGFNDAFLIDNLTRERLAASTPNAHEIIKPIIRGRDIKRYYIMNPKYFLINTHNGYERDDGRKYGRVDINKYPIIKEHLDSYIIQLQNRQDKGKTVYNLRDCAFIQEFEKEKIVWHELTNTNKFAYSNKEEYLLAGAFFMTGESLKYLLSFLNSRLCLFYFYLICNSSGMATIQWKKFALDKVPIVKLETNKQKPFIEIVDQILTLTASDNYLIDKDKQLQVKEFENQIDRLIYRLYGLTDEEIKIVEGEK